MLFDFNISQLKETLYIEYFLNYYAYRCIFLRNIINNVIIDVM